MYSEGGWIMIAGILLSLGVVALFVWYVNVKIKAQDDQQWLTRFVALMLTALLGLFLVDKVVDSKLQLLTDQMSSNLFELIKNITLIIFGYQFNVGSKNKTTPP